MKSFQNLITLLILSIIGLNCWSCASPGKETDEDQVLERKIDFWIGMMETVEGQELNKYQFRLITHGDKAYPKVVKGLKHISPQVRGSCAFILGQVGNKEAIDHLIPLLDDPADKVRFDAAASLVDLEENIGLYYLILALDHAVPYFRDQANRMLVQSTGQDFGFEAEGHPLDRRDTRNDWIRWWNQNKDTFRLGGKKNTPKTPVLKEIELEK